MEFTLLGAALVAIGALYGVLRWEAGTTNAAGSTRALWDIALAAVLAGVAVGRLSAMVRDGINPLADPTEILIVRGGVDTGFAALAALAVLVAVARRDLWRTLDAIAPAALAALAGWHGACVIRGACLGTPTELPWGLAQSGSAVTRHPVEIYAALGLGGAAIALIVWKRHGPVPGALAGMALAAAGAIRLATEPMRPVIGTGPVAWYIAGVVAGLALAGWRATAGSRPESPDLGAAPT